MIAASRCPSCGRVAVPPEPRCQACRAATEDREVDPEGTVLTYTSRAEDWVALVELEGGARAWVACDEEPAIGDELGVDRAAQG